ncbi:MAG: replication restart helicase PriA [Eubacteriales bacterium]|jgi:primosomal protein N' (replication factor Y)
MVATVYVRGTLYKNDRPYDYQVPFQLEERISVGSRVTVPYGAGDRPREAVVVELKEESEYQELKTLRSLVEAEPVSGEMLRLARWVKRQYFCTFYEALRLTLPPGAFVRFAGEQEIVRDGKRYRRFACLTEEESARRYLEELPPRYAAQAEVLESLLAERELPVSSLCSLSAVQTLVKKGLVTLEERVVERDPYGDLQWEQEAPKELHLNPEQASAVRQMEQWLEEDQSHTALLHGVTGSGKTVVFLQIIAKALAMGRSALLLVPEISLTPQMVQVFYRQFGRQVAVLHSAMSVGERSDAWRQIRRGEKTIVIGTRMSVFAPLVRPGVFIIDEEQEGTYKSEMAPRYDAREVAALRNRWHKALLVLASATPSVESYWRARQGEYHLLELPHRYNGKPLPPTHIVDMTAELKRGNRTMFSDRLLEELRINREKGEQSILFLNRRGYSTFLSCRECGYVVTCPNCAVSMTYHQEGRMQCHYCGCSQPVPQRCPECGSPYIRYFGAGTQQVAEKLSQQLPGLRVMRMDADTTAHKDSHRELLERFRQGEADVLVGTQMVVKGLDIPNVTLVGVLNADLSLYVEDYRAPQNTFSLIAQVVGRCGRGHKEGRAVIQTYTPANSTIRYGAAQEYLPFYEEEISMRRLMGYPPFCDLWVVTITGEEEAPTQAAIQAVAEALQKAIAFWEGWKLIGPSPCRVSRIKGEYRYRVILKGRSEKRMLAMMDSLLKTFYNKREFKQQRITVDRNPYSFV